MDPDGDLDLEALTVLVPGSPPRPADAMDMGEGLGDLDLEALQVLAPPPRVDRHGAAHMAAMRQCLAKKRLERAREEVNAEKNKAADAMSLVAVLAPSAARAAGLPVGKRLKAGVDISAPLGLALMRVAFAGSIRMAAERQHTFAYQTQATLCKAILERQAVGLPVIMHVARSLSMAGWTTVIGFNFEQDAAQVSFKSLGKQLEKRLHEQLAAIDAGRSGGRQHRGRFQAGACDSILNVSGSVSIYAQRGEEKHFRGFHWFLPPLAVPDTKVSSLLSALRRTPPWVGSITNEAVVA